MPSRRPDADLDAVLSFLPLFGAAGISFGRWHDDGDGRVEVKYSEDVRDFVRLLEERGWVEPGCRPGAVQTALRHWQEPALVATADLPTLRLLLSDIVRTERICAGHLLEACERGYLPAILARLKALRQAAGKEPR